MPGVRFAIGLLPLLLTTSGFRAIRAQPPPEPHDLAVVFDPNGTTFCDFPPPFTTDEEFWVVGYFLDGGVAGYEFGLVIDPMLIIFNSVPNPIDAINVGTPPTNWIVGTRVCLDGSDVLPLVAFTYGYFTANATDMTICPTASTPTSFTPGMPGYLRCDDTLVPMSLFPDRVDYGWGCAVVNPTDTPFLQKAPFCGPIVATDVTSWGAVKARY